MSLDVDAATGAVVAELFRAGLVSANATASTLVRAALSEYLGARRTAGTLGGTADTTCTCCAQCGTSGSTTGSSTAGSTATGSGSSSCPSGEEWDSASGTCVEDSSAIVFGSSFIILIGAATLITLMACFAIWYCYVRRTPEEQELSDKLQRFSILDAAYEQSQKKNANRLALGEAHPEGDAGGEEELVSRPESGGGGAGRGGVGRGGGGSGGNAGEDKLAMTFPSVSGASFNTAPDGARGDGGGLPGGGAAAGMHASPPTPGSPAGSWRGMASPKGVGAGGVGGFGVAGPPTPGSPSGMPLGHTPYRGSVSGSSLASSRRHTMSQGIF